MTVPIAGDHHTTTRLAQALLTIWDLLCVTLRPSASSALNGILTQRTRGPQSYAEIKNNPKSDPAQFLPSRAARYARAAFRY